MAPQTSIPPAATILGLIGTILWSVQLCPQLWHSYRSKKTDGLPAMMVFCWSWASLPFGIYAISQNFNIGLQIQPQCFGSLCMVSWGQIMYYGRKWPAWKAVAACTVMLTINVVLQVTFVLVIREPYRRGVEWPVTLFGFIAITMVLVGYVPVPFELIKRRGRITGMSLLFVLMDLGGATFSLMSLVAQNTFDPEFGSLYAICALAEALMFVSHWTWLFRTRGIRRRAKEAGVPYDEFPEAIEWQDAGFKISFSKILRRFSPTRKSQQGIEQQEVEIEQKTPTASPKGCSQVTKELL